MADIDDIFRDDIFDKDKGAPIIDPRDVFHDVTFQDLRPKSFQHFFDEATLALFPIGPERPPGDVGDMTYSLAREHARLLLLRAISEHEAGRTKQAWPFLVEAHGIGQKYHGFSEARLFAERTNIAEHQRKIGKVGLAIRKENLQADDDKLEKVVDHMALLPLSLAWAEPEKMRAALVDIGDLLGIEVNTARVTRLLKHAKIRKLMATSKRHVSKGTRP